MKRLHEFVVDHEFELQLLVASLILLAVLCHHTSAVMEWYREVRR